MSLPLFRFMRFNSFMSIHAFQFMRFNSFMSIHSCRFIRFNSFMSILSFQFIHFKSFISIHSFQFLRFSLCVSRFNSIISSRSFQLIHVIFSCISLKGYWNIFEHEMVEDAARNHGINRTSKKQELEMPKKPGSFDMTFYHLFLEVKGNGT